MKAYRDINGDSGVSAYEYGDDWIRVNSSTGEPMNIARQSLDQPI